MTRYTVQLNIPVSVEVDAPGPFTAHRLAGQAVRAKLRQDTSRSRTKGVDSVVFSDAVVEGTRAIIQ